MRSRLFIGLMFVVAAGMGWFACQSGGRMPAVVSLPPKPDTALLQRVYDLHREPTITHRRFKHADIQTLILRHRDSSRLDVTEIGKSVLGKPIYHVRYGEGPQAVLLWSQMHGNEPTATMALMDLFNFLSGTGEGLDSL